MNFDYIDKLDNDTKVRYNAKLSLINGEDPYKTPKDKWTCNPAKYPAIFYPDIVNHLVNSKSAYSLSDLKAYKGLEAYNQFVCGWVSDVVSREVNKLSVVIGKVRHSQSVAKSPLLPWIIAETNGCVLAAHCTCMAGLGEVCTHVGALLFMLSAAVTIRNGRTVTEEKAYWLLPTGVKAASYKPVEQINFKSAKTLKKDLDCAISGTPPRETQSLKLPNVSPPTADELSTLFAKLHASGDKASILSVVPEYAHHYVPKPLHIDYPPLLSELRDERCFAMDLQELQSHCETVFHSISVSSKQSEIVEQNTQKQAGSREWHRFRTGRVTASRVKSVCRTNPDSPAQSLIKNICYPDARHFQTKATKWGCDHESDALKSYTDSHASEHARFRVQSCGFVISTEHPFMGASPDSLVECDCCGKGAVEVKCPYCIRDKSVTDPGDKVAWLELVDGSLCLKKEHQYFYQVQMHMLICSVDYVDFVVWTKAGLHVERIEPDNGLCNEIIARSTTFFKRALLPELVGKFFSREQPNALQMGNVDTENNKHSETKSTTTIVNTELFCTCQTTYDEREKYIGCDNVACIIKWCHFKCVGIKRAPKGAWYCIQCRKLPQFSASKKRKSCM